MYFRKILFLYLKLSSYLVVMNFIRYQSRFEAGQRLALLIRNEHEELKELLVKDKALFFCYAIPNGGIPVAEGFCTDFDINYDFLIVRKVKIPFNTEAGFGSVTTDGSVLINQPLLNRLNLTERQVNDAIELTKQEIKQRLEFYKKEGNLEDGFTRNIQGKHVFMIDDGLASGFTMLAAINMIKKYQPAKLFIAVPTAPLRTIKNILPKVDEVFCPNIRDVMWFAVADAYKNWYDVPESEVLKIISNSKCYVSKLDN